MTKKLIYVLLTFAATTFAAERGEEIKLWPNGAPGSEGITAQEVSKPSVNAKYAKLPGDISVSHYPSIYVFLPPKAQQPEPPWWSRLAAGTRTSSWRRKG